jgi:hypothetical protein
VSKILTFHDIPEAKFARIMDLATQNNSENLLYFSKDRYEAIQFQDATNNRFADCAYDGVKKIQGYTFVSPNFSDIVSKHFSNIRFAIRQTFNNNLNKGYIPRNQAHHPYVQGMLDMIEHGKNHNMNDLVFAYQSCKTLIEQYFTTLEQPNVMNTLNQRFLQGYIHHMSDPNLTNIIDPYLQDVRGFDMGVLDADNAIWGLVDEFDAKIPTLENLGIKVNISYKYAFDKAQELSNILQNTATEACRELVDDKINEYDMLFGEQTEELTDPEHT